MTDEPGWIAFTFIQEGIDGQHTTFGR